MKKIGAYVNGNYKVVIFDDGTKIRAAEDDEFIPAFAENCDVKITNCCDIGCKFCHEASCLEGKHGDILNAKFIDSLHPFTELAIGGGDATSHPDLIPFLERLKEKKVFANLTVNQIHFEKKQELIKKLIDEKLINGIGISLVNPTDEFLALVSQYKNAVIHTINGILSEKDIEKMANKDIKMLILGYKHFRNGVDFYDKNTEKIKNKQKYVYDNLQDIFSKFKVVSFDNLAVEQLDVKRFMTDEEWEEFYMGDDGTMTFYIDLVNEKFASSSTSPIRYDLLDTVDQMFQIVKEEKR